MTERDILSKILPNKEETKKFVKSYNYSCGRCGKTQCRLWREPQIFMSGLTLLCRECAEQEQQARSRDLAPKNIGSRILAVPSEFPNITGKLSRDTTFFGYNDVPKDKLNWWMTLPE